MPIDRLHNNLKERSGKGHSLKVGPFLLAILLQGILLAGTVFVVVFVPRLKPEPEFSSRKTIYLPQRQLEHRMEVAEWQQVSSPPVLLDKLTTAALLPDSLPNLPSLPRIEYNLMENDNPVAAADSLFGITGLINSLQGLKGESSSASLFGIEDSGERILLLFDDGGSVLNKARRSGIPESVIKEEAIHLVDGLNANTLFGFIHFVRRVGTFQDYLVPATSANKMLVREWITSTLATRRGKRTQLPVSGSGIEAAMKVAFRFDPEIIFLLSDADFQRYRGGTKKGEQVPWDDLFDTVRQLQRKADKKVRIHFIGFQVEEEDKKNMRRLVGRSGGKYREMD